MSPNNDKNMKNLSPEIETLPTVLLRLWEQTFFSPFLVTKTYSCLQANNKPAVIPSKYGSFLLKVVLFIAITSDSTISLAQVAGANEPGVSSGLSLDKDRIILQRVQLGVFTSRAEAGTMVSRLRQLDFETFIIKEKKGFWVSVGAFSSKANLERELSRLDKAGLSDKVKVVKVDAKRSQLGVPKKRKPRSTVFRAKVPETPKIGSESQFVPKQDYEKLKQEVEALKAQMRLLVNKELPEEHSTETVAASTPSSSAQQTKRKSEQSETQTQEVGDQQHPKTESKSSQTAEREEEQQTKDEAKAKEKSDNKNDISVAEGSREKEAEVSKRELDTFLRGQKVLFKSGELVLEYNLAYSRDTAVNSFGVNPANGQPTSTPKLISSSVNTGLLFRYGLADDLELDVTIPFGYSDQKQDARPFAFPDGTQIRRSESLGLGDVNGSLSYTAWPETGNMPSITFNVNAKSNTGESATFGGTGVSQSNGLGNGFWSVGGGVSLTKTIDPVVFFGSIGYVASLEEGGIDPGDQVSYSFGSGFSMNDRVSLSMALSGAVARRAKINGEEVVGSSVNINTLQLTSTIKLSKGLFVEPFVSFGLNKEAQDFMVGFNVPFRFDRRFPLPFVHD